MICWRVFFILITCSLISFLRCFSNYRQRSIIGAHSTLPEWLLRWAYLSAFSPVLRPSSEVAEAGVEQVERERGLRTSPVWLFDSRKIPLTSVSLEASDRPSPQALSWTRLALSKHSPSLTSLVSTTRDTGDLLPYRQPHLQLGPSFYAPDVDIQLFTW